MRLSESENVTGSVNERYNVRPHRHPDLQQNPRMVFDYDTPEKHCGCGIGIGIGICCVQKATSSSLGRRPMTLHSLSH